jgi:hypothetical protein
MGDSLLSYTAGAGSQLGTGPTRRGGDRVRYPVACVGDPIRTQFLGLGRPDTKADLGVCDERRGYPRRWAECNSLRSAAFSSERPINRDDGRSSADGIRYKRLVDKPSAQRGAKSYQRRVPWQR